MDFERPDRLPASALALDLAPVLDPDFGPALAPVTVADVFPFEEDAFPDFESLVALVRRAGARPDFGVAAAAGRVFADPPPDVPSPRWAGARSCSEAGSAFPVSRETGRAPALAAGRFGRPGFRTGRFRGVFSAAVFPVARAVGATEERPASPAGSFASRVDDSAILPVVATVVSEGIGSVSTKARKLVDLVRTDKHRDRIGEMLRSAAPSPRAIPDAFEGSRSEPPSLEIPGRSPPVSRPAEGLCPLPRYPRLARPSSGVHGGGQGGRHRASPLESAPTAPARNPTGLRREGIRVSGACTNARPAAERIRG